MTIKKEVIYLDTNEEVNKKENAKKPTLEEMQKYVDGWIQPLKVKFDGRICTMIVNEEGLIRQLPYNHTASVISGRCIVGKVIILVGYRL